MSQTARKVLTIVGVVVLAWATAGVGLAVLGGAGVGAAAGATAFGLTAATWAQIGVGLIAIGSAPNPKKLEQTGANSRGTALADPNALGVYAFGTTALPLNLVFEVAYPSSVPDHVGAIFAHAWHRIESYLYLYVQGELVAFTGDSATGDWAGILTWERKDGAPGQTALTGATADWTSTATFTGVAHSQMIWAFRNQDKIQAIPSQMDLVAEGAWLYDPRLDPSYGAGTQDFADPTTWSFNDGNDALVALRYLIGERVEGGTELIWGRGVSEAELLMDTFIAMANLSDESVDSKPRFRMGGIWQLSGDFEAFCRQWEEETGGKIYKDGAQYGIWLPHDDLTALTTITEDDLIEGASIEHGFAAGIEGLYNTARGRYIEPTEGYRGFPYPEVSESSAITEDGEKRVLAQDFSWVQDVEIAQRTARIKIRRSRFQRIFTIPMGWKGFGPSYAPFTVHNLNIKETGGASRLVRVVHRTRSLVGIAMLTLQEEDSSIYDDTVALGSAFSSGSASGRTTPFGTTTPRYIDGRAIDELRPTEYGATNNLPDMWLEQFNYADSAEFQQHWTVREGSGEIAFYSGLTGVPGGSFIRLGTNYGDDEVWATLTDRLIQYDQNTLYEVGCIMRVLGATGTPLFYCGLEGVAGNGTTLINKSGANSYGSQHYIAAESQAVGVATTWTMFRGYVQGLGTTAGAQAWDPLSPTKMYSGVAFVRPLFIANYSHVAGETDIAALWVRRVPGKISPLDIIDNPALADEAATELYQGYDAGPVSVSNIT